MNDDILTRYPGMAGKPLAMALMCAPLVERGCHADAYAMGCAALDAAPHDDAVRYLVHTTLSAGVPRFHLSMLHDAPRNACYAAAIARMVTPGMRVLEIGTGSGLLALLAAQAGAEVVTCESNPMIAAAAQAIVVRNGYADRIRVVPKRSTDLRIGVDLAEPCDLLVSEVFGDELIEEGVVNAVGDARARLLRPGAAIIPPRARLRCALVSDDRPDPMPLDTVLGFDLSPFAPLTKSRRHVPSRPSPRVTLRSSPVSALAIDFTGAPIGTLHDRIALASDGGRVDGLALWLHLDFGDGVIYENVPFTSSVAHWIAPIHTFATPLETVSGQMVEVDVRAFGTRLVVGMAN